MLGIGGQPYSCSNSPVSTSSRTTCPRFSNSRSVLHTTSLCCALLAEFNDVAYFLSSLIPIWVIDRLGRRKLMLFAAAGQGACMAILAGTVANGSASAGMVATFMLFLFNFFFTVGLLAIPWLRESFPTYPPPSAVPYSTPVYVRVSHFYSPCRVHTSQLLSDKRRPHWLQFPTGSLPSWLSRLPPLVSAISGS